MDSLEFAGVFVLPPLGLFVVEVDELVQILDLVDQVGLVLLCARPQHSFLFLLVLVHHPDELLLVEAVGLRYFML